MMSANVRPSSVLPLASRIAPQTLDGSTDAAASTGWIDASLAQWLVAVINIGTVSSGGTLTLSWQQSASSDGSNPATLDDGDFDPVTYTAAGDHIVEERVDLLTEGYRYVRATLTSDVANVICGMTLHFGAPKHETGPSISTGIPD